MNICEIFYNPTFSKINIQHFLICSNGMQWTKVNLHLKIHCVFVDVSDSLIILSRHSFKTKVGDYAEEIYNFY